MANNSKKGMIIAAVVALLLCCCCCLSVLTGGAAFSMSPAPASDDAGASAEGGDDAADDADGADADDDSEDDKDEPEGANAASSSPAGVVAKACTRKVTATRTDSGNRTHGWGMDLRFKCDDTLVHIGRAMGGGPKHKNVNFDGKGCPDVVNKSNWLGTDTYPDHFDVDVSDCVD